MDTTTARKPLVRFAHYKLFKGFVTLSASVDEGNVNVGVAYCHPRDRLDKSKGRALASKRRDAGSDFSFTFKRNHLRLDDQLRDEFEQFVIETGKAIRALEDAEVKDIPRMGAPPWVIHSLNRELRDRAKFARQLEEADINNDTNVCYSDNCCC